MPASSISSTRCSSLETKLGTWLNASFCKSSSPRFPLILSFPCCAARSPCFFFFEGISKRERLDRRQLLAESFLFLLATTYCIPFSTTIRGIWQKEKTTWKPDLKCATVERAFPEAASKLRSKLSSISLVSLATRTMVTDFWLEPGLL